MQLVINDGEKVKIVAGSHRGKYGTVEKCIVTPNGLSLSYNISLKKEDTKAKWPFVTMNFPSDQVKKIRTK